MKIKDFIKDFMKEVQLALKTYSSMGANSPYYKGYKEGYTDALKAVKARLQEKIK